jgi:4-amino-4-deoxy-L-arabinose transferase-like glycosyltransferase
MHAAEQVQAAPARTTVVGQHPQFLLPLITLLALGLRVVFLTLQPLWWDEGWSVYFATIDVGAMLERTAVDIHPPLYYLLLHLWVEVLGSSVQAVRLLSVLIGTVTVPVLYACGQRLGSRASGLVAALLLAISPFHIYYSQEVRMYGLVTLLGCAALYLALRGEWQGGQRLWIVWLGYVLVGTAALYTQYYAAFLLLALNVSALVRWLQSRRAGRQILPWLSAQVVVALLYLPWLWYAGSRLVAYVRFKVSVEEDPSLGVLSYLARHLVAANWGHAEGLLASVWWLGLLPLVVLLASLATLLARQAFREQLGTWLRKAGHWPGSILLITLTAGFLVNLAFPFNPPRSERLLLLALPAYLLLVAAGYLALWRYRRPLAILSMVTLLTMALASLAFFYTVPRYPDDDYRPVAARVGALAMPSDAVVAVHPWQVGYFRAYLPDEESRPKVVLTPRRVLPREQQLWGEDPALMAADLEKLLANQGRIWLPAHQAMGRLLESQIKAYLVEQAYPVLSEWHGENTVLSLYTAGEPKATPLTAEFGEWLILENAALGSELVAAGWGVVPVDLTWRLSERPLDDYQVGLRLVDGAGRVWAQRDSPPLDGLQPFSDWPLEEPREDHHGLLVPAGTPPGEYEMTLRVYRSTDLSVAPVAFAGGSGGEVVLGQVRVNRPETPPPVASMIPAQATADPVLADFGGRLRLLGSSVANAQAYLPGEAIEVALFWQVLAAPREDFLPRLQIVDAGGQVLAEHTEKPVYGSYPTAWWQADELVRDRHALPIPATVPEGRYRLALSLVRAADGSAIAIEGNGTTLDLANVEVRGRAHTLTPTTPEHALAAEFDQAVELTGYDLEEKAYGPGASLEITLHWHVLETPERDYWAFVHLLDPEGEIVAQHDGVPGQGELPALGWLPGEYLLDAHSIYLPVGLTGGVYRLRVGLFDPSTGVRPGEPLVLDSPVRVESRQP